MRYLLGAGCALLLAVACAHGTRTGKNAETRDAAAPESTGAAARARKVTPDTPPSSPPLAGSPSELLQPGSQGKIAEALRRKGVAGRDDLRGEQLTAAVRKFQKSQGLAETGFPDHETLLRLGLDPKEVDRSLDSLSGARPGEAQGDLSTHSEEAGKGRSGTPHDTPPSDDKGSSASGDGGG